ncbi:peptidoglycan-binding domain-containing protein [Gottfriedia luciferensis]|uniref:peptidoglycan-binding domain-containing protein n=1 Tax=Gottfriedia luciferensis TaxID=178774 RepID=UPI001302AA2E|nr:peptidoglycan-binding domain-containing protein [Gottfriedia luciferensis]
MKKKFHYKAAIIIFCIISISILMVSTYLPKKQAGAFTSQVLSRGSTGQDVKELQGRLKFIGFFNGKVDGIAGSKLKEKLTKATKNYNGNSTNNTANNKPAKPDTNKPNNTKKHWFCDYWMKFDENTK